MHARCCPRADPPPLIAALSVHLSVHRSETACTDPVYRSAARGEHTWCGGSAAAPGGPTPSALPLRLNAATPVHSPRSPGSARLTEGFALCRLTRAGRALHRGIHPHPVFALSRGDKTKKRLANWPRPSGPAGRRLFLVLSPRSRERFDGVPSPVRWGSQAAHPPLVALGRSSLRVCLRRLGAAAQPTR